MNKMSKEISKQLAKCPFCGGDNVGLWNNRSASPLIQSTCEVHCYDCHFGLAPSKTKEEAIEAWNNRKPMDRIMERLEDNKIWSELLIYSLTHREREIIKKAIEIVKEEGES